MKNLKVARALRSMSQQKLADNMGITKKMIANYEAGICKPKVETLIKMSEVLGVSTDVLLDLKNFKEG